MSNPTMMRHTALLISLLLAPAWLGATEHDSTDTWLVSLQPGASFPIGDIGNDPSVKLSQVLDPSGYLAASAIYQTIENWSPGIELGYGFGHRLSGNFGDASLDVTSDVRLHLFEAAPVVQIGPWWTVDGLTFKPYVLVGAGYYRTWTNSGSVTATSLLSGRSSTGVSEGESDDNFGVTGGVGLQFKAGRWVFGAEARYHRIFAGRYLFRPTSDDEQFVIPTARIGILFP